MFGLFKKKKNELLPNYDPMTFEVILSLISALEFREPNSAGHAQRVTMYALKIAKQLKLKKQQIENLRYAGLLHDIGKIGIKDSIINKKGKLSKIENEEIKKHTIIAKSILNPILSLKDIIVIIYHHHENWNGTGYPDGKKGLDIPLESRIISVADYYDNSITGKSYYKKLSQREIIQDLIKGKNKQFDANIVDSFIQVLRNQ